MSGTRVSVFACVGDDESVGISVASLYLFSCSTPFCATAPVVVSVF